MTTICFGVFLVLIRFGFTFCLTFTVLKNIYRKSTENMYILVNYHGATPVHNPTHKIEYCQLLEAPPMPLPNHHFPEITTIITSNLTVLLCLFIDFYVYII